jgi:hypothetical protein
VFDSRISPVKFVYFRVDIESKFNCYQTYLNYFNKHIVATCNMPKSDKIKSCRKISKHIKNHKTTKKN